MMALSTICSSEDISLRTDGSKFISNSGLRSNVELTLASTEGSKSLSTIALQNSIGGNIILGSEDGSSQPLYYNAVNDLSQVQQPILTHELYYNSEKNNNNASSVPSSLTQTSIPNRRLRTTNEPNPTAAPITATVEKAVTAPTVDVIDRRKIIDNNNIIHTKKKSFLKYEKPSRIEPYNTVLNNGREFPMVGIGAGNIPKQRIPLMINEAMYSVRLVDTSKEQSNESLVARSILRWLKAQSKVKIFDPSQHVIHVITKIWYTHLGYERTTLSIRESLADLSSILSISKNIGYQVKVHAIIQYPRCYDEIEWMRCQEEEMELDSHARFVGPDPNLDPDNAWKGSYKAMEEMYNSNLLESIGVSNFKLNDMSDLLDMCTVIPQIFQGNLYNIIYDTELMNLLAENKIFFQAYNIMRDTYGRKTLSPKSFAALQRIGLNYAIDDMPSGFSGAQVISAWLVQHGHGVIPESSQEQHLIENLPQYVRKIPKFANLHDVDVHTSLVSLLKGIDTSEYHFSGIDTSRGVVVTFYNDFSKAVKIFAFKNGRQIAASAWMETGKSNRVIASAKDVFVAYDVEGTAIKRFKIEKSDGLEESLTIS